jgi:hypothetical protein
MAAAAGGAVARASTAGAVARTCRGHGAAAGGWTTHRTAPRVRIATHPGQQYSRIPCAHSCCWQNGHGGCGMTWSALMPATKALCVQRASRRPRAMRIARAALPPNIHKHAAPARPLIAPITCPAAVARHSARRARGARPREGAVGLMATRRGPRAIAVARLETDRAIVAASRLGAAAKEGLTGGRGLGGARGLVYPIKKSLQARALSNWDMGYLRDHTQERGAGRIVLAIAGFVGGMD